MSTIAFRDKPIPEHRKNRKECQEYSSYLKTLIVDFNKRCGYCNDINSYKVRSFAIDHFVPRNPIDFKHPIKPNNYYNLVYACNYCNGAKSNKFPTKNHEQPYDEHIGFVMPTDAKYDDLFCRDIDGSILSKDNNPLANYIIKELNLKNPIHSLMWRLEKLVTLTDIVIQKIKDTKNQELIDLQNELYSEYYTITRSIFLNND